MNKIIKKYISYLTDPRIYLQMKGKARKNEAQKVYCMLHVCYSYQERVKQASSNSDTHVWQPPM